MAKIIIEIPQKLVLTDTFAIWRDKINRGFEFAEELLTATNKEVDRLDKRIDDLEDNLEDKLRADIEEAVEQEHLQIMNTINNNDKNVNARVDKLQDQIDLDVMGWIIALG